MWTRGGYIYIYIYIYMKSSFSKRYKFILIVFVRIERGRFKSSRLYARYRESRERKQEQVGREKGETHGVVGWNEAETQLMENV